MVMKVVNDKNLSVEQLIMALAQREQDLYNSWQDRIIMEGEDAPETLARRDEWVGVYEFMQNMVIGVEQNESVGAVEL
jgi:hypothetical protein